MGRGLQILLQRVCSLHRQQLAPSGSAPDSGSEPVSCPHAGLDGSRPPSPGPKTEGPSSGSAGRGGLQPACCRGLWGGHSSLRAGQREAGAWSVQLLGPGRNLPGHCTGASSPPASPPPPMFTCVHPAGVSGLVQPPQNWRLWPAGAPAPVSPPCVVAVCLSAAAYALQCSELAWSLAWPEADAAAHSSPWLGGGWSLALGAFTSTHTPSSPACVLSALPSEHLNYGRLHQVGGRGSFGLRLWPPAQMLQGQSCDSEPRLTPGGTWAAGPQVWASLLSCSPWKGQPLLLIHLWAALLVPLQVGFASWAPSLGRWTVSQSVCYLRRSLAATCPPSQGGRREHSRAVSLLSPCPSTHHLLCQLHEINLFLNS
ncbi:BTB/POZ domain-containing protein KCTD5 isoform X1 [Canis lupus dingo]|uniref:BTB/POZ domain-containing protein KCTD5 isoform X1 n=1 Tax=Canis lupus dingo TaxID=286419 RepID=UPI0020C5547D|nr:BTB/POZ domain-containing protein KCTD5 isoform X1 [Canis lupus dingo]XP_048967442.1 BTB/POZ domain-containing protein KCTD5 isoform X1 [Canis lupus dingo]XP_048967443.1 BTB/POZ domain-containing protein KCTD5 isoform X1 [Canis lupus dingo]